MYTVLNKGPSLMTLCVPVFLLKRFQIFGFRGNINLSAPPPYQKPHFPCFRHPFQVETFTPCLQRRLLAGDPPSRCSASSIQAGNPHPTPILPSCQAFLVWLYIVQCGAQLTFGSFVLWCLFNYLVQFCNAMFNSCGCILLLYSM